MFPTITTTRISMSATEIPNRMEIKLASNASPIQNAAMNQIFSIISAIGYLPSAICYWLLASNLRLFQVRVRPVINHPHFLQCHQPAFHHLIEYRQKRLDLL